jgi:DNA polymerase I-like protein with 3'-5' exonuclease and polymerase domains
MYTFLPFEQNIAGLAICWSSSAVYFISLSTKNKHKQHEIEARWAAVRRVMANPKSKKVQFSMKPQLKMLMSHEVDGKRYILCANRANIVVAYDGLMDPRIAAWILDSDNNKDKSLEQLYQEYDCGSYNYDNFHYPSDQFSTAFIRAHQSLELMRKLLEHLALNENEMNIFTKLEMPVVYTLAKMEFYGIGFKSSIYNHYRDLILVSRSNNVLC